LRRVGCWGVRSGVSRLSVVFGVRSSSSSSSSLLLQKEPLSSAPFNFQTHFNAFRFFCSETNKYENDPVLADIHKEVNSSPCVLYMKGTPTQPMCGYSNAVLKILKQEGANFKSFDVLSDQNLREGIKRYSEWPTIPQVYLKGDFVGGCDIMMDLYQSGKLNKMLKDAGALTEQKV